MGTSLLLLVLCAQASPPVTLTAVGDVMFARYRPRHGKPPLYDRVAATDTPFAGVAELLSGADLTFANLETPVAPPPERVVPHFVLTFRAEPSDLGTLTGAGFDLLSLANNHAANLGPAGAAETRRQVDAAGLHATGSGTTREQALEPVLVEVRGKKIALLAASVWDNREPQSDADGSVAYVPWPELAAEMVPRIRALRQRPDIDFIIVSLHWGLEHHDRPAQVQRDRAHELVDAGADVILGHHPHVIQDVERYGRGLIAYSLGNFLFDARSRATRDSLVLSLDLEGAGPERGVGAVRIYPVVLGARAHVPVLAHGSDYCRLARRYAAIAEADVVAPAETRCPDKPLAQAGF